MNKNLVNIVVENQLKKDVPEFSAGDTVVVSLKIVEGDKFRTQNFEGLVVSRRGSGIAENFIVRKISNGVGVEKTINIHSPLVEQIKVLRRGKVRRSRIYYIRSRSGKSARITEKK